MPRGAVVQIRVSEEEKGRWVEAAGKVDATLTGWIRHVCNVVVEGEGVVKAKGKRAEVLTAVPVVEGGSGPVKCPYGCRAIHVHVR